MERKNTLEFCKELIGKEMTLLDMDNKMGEYFYSEYDSIDEELIESGCIIYICKRYLDLLIGEDDMIRIEFEVTCTACEDEDIRGSYIRIKDIQY